MERLIWPDDLLDEAQVRSWIATTVPAVSTVAGPIKIEQVKSWGVVARFTVRFNDHREQEVVFKASHLPLFTYGPVVDQLLMRYCPDYAPELLGWQQWDERAWMLYRPFSAPRVSTQMSAERLSQIATTFAYLQTRIAEAPPAEVTAIPRTVVAALPTQFEAVIREIVDRQWQIWHNDEPWLLEEFQIPADLIRRLRAFTAQVARWADELASIDWPATIEHADLQADNAVLTTAGTILLFDWEEATIGCPFFSLYRLLDDARTLEQNKVGVRKPTPTGIAPASWWCARHTSRRFRGIAFLNGRAPSIWQCAWHRFVRSMMASCSPQRKAGPKAFRHKSPC